MNCFNASHFKPIFANHLFELTGHPTLISHGLEIIVGICYFKHLFPESKVEICDTKEIGADNNIRCCTVNNHSHHTAGFIGSSYTVVKLASRLSSLTTTSVLCSTPFRQTNNRYTYHDLPFRHRPRVYNEGADVPA